jgi:transcriptional regulator with XRE-family HTH domain
MKFAQVSNIDEARDILSDRLKEIIYYGDTHSFDSAQRVSEATGISKSYISSIIHGKKTPSLEYIFMLAYTLNQSVLDIISGLELFIKPKGYNIKDKSDAERRNYYLAVENEWNRFMNKQRTVEAKESTDNGRGIKSSNEMVMLDKSMEAVGMPKGCIISYKSVDEEVINGGVYIIRYNNKTYPRRIWIEGDNVILIPCSTSLSFDIISVHREDMRSEGIEIVGIPLGVAYIFNQ